MGYKKFDAPVFFGKFGIVIILVILMALFSSLNPAFRSWANIINILRQVSIVGIMAVGMTMVLLAGCIDLSVGSIAGCGTVIAAILLKAGVPWWGTLLIIMMGGCLIGLCNGFFVAHLDIPPLIASLGMMISLRGAAYLITNGKPVFGFPPDILFLGRGMVLGIPFPVWIMITLFAVGIIFLSKTRTGRYIYGVGGNEEASRLSGINTKKIKMFVFATSATLAALAGVVLLARINSGQPKSGDGYEMDVITAVVLGGTSISGGEGNLIFVKFGVLIMGVLKNGMNMVNISDYVQQFISGLVLIAAVAFDRYMQRIKQRQVKAYGG